jgi:predicted HTH domain antitoxin
MTIVTIEMPDDVFGTLRKSPQEFSQEMRIAAACHWYSQGVVSQGKGAEIAGLSRAEFISELARRRIAVGQYSLDEVLEEVGRA